MMVDTDMYLNVPSSSYFYERFPHHSELSKPEKISEFSVTKERQVIMDRSLARYIWPDFLCSKLIQIDLNGGFEEFERWPSGKEERLGIVSQWLQVSCKPETYIKDEFRTDVITGRGAMKIIAMTPYRQATPWTCVATKRKNVVYLYAKQPPHQREAEKEDRVQKMILQAYKFEQCVTIGENQEKPDPSPPVSVWEEFRVVVRTVLKRKEAWPIRIMMAAEVDSIDIDDDLTEIATNFGPINEYFWKAKSMNNFLQCKLVGIDSVLIGIKGTDAVVREIKILTVDELERGGRPFWNKGICLDVLHNVLTCIRNAVKNNETCVVEFSGVINAPITIRKVCATEEPVLTQQFMDYFGLG